MRYITLSFLAACFLATGCGATHDITMRVQNPAVVDLPPYIQEVGIVNRTLAEEDPPVLDKIDRILSAEGKRMDSLGAAAGIKGLANELSRNERVEARVVPETRRLGNPAFGVFPAPLQWTSVEEMCMEYGLDGLFVLEFYDTDSRIRYTTREVMIEGPLNTRIPALEHRANVVTAIKTGWRIYDSEGRNIIDEFVMEETISTTGAGINPVEAIKAVTGRIEAVLAVSRDLGRGYAQSILPYWTRVTREYFVRGNANFEKAKRRAQTGNWDGAAEIWLMETDNPDPKLAGRAHYNMAIIEEIRGNIDNAIEWAQAAYEEFGEKRALNYLDILRYRKNQLEMLRLQQE